MVSATLMIGLASYLPQALRRIENKLPLKVKELHVMGTQSLKTPEIEKLLPIHPGDLMYGKWTSEAVKKLKENPRIDEAIVVRSLTGDVMVKIGERKSAALVNLDRLYYVDESGNLLGKIDPKSDEPTDLVVLTGPWGGKKSLGGFTDLIRRGIEMKKTLVSAGMNEKELSEIHWDPKRGFGVYRVEMKAPIWIGRENLPQKASRLVSVLKDFRGKEKTVREIDVDFDDRVVVKLNRDL